MYVSPITRAERINILASSKNQKFTYQVSDEGVAADEKGRKVVPAGTILPANDATAQGILFNAVEVTHGPQPGALIVKGYILKERLPVAPTPEAEEALKAIGFEFR